MNGHSGCHAGEVLTLARLLLLPPLAALLGGCSSSAAGRAEDTAQPASTQSPVLVQEMASRYLPEASVEGRLSLQHGCLVIRDAVAGDSVAYFPEGTTWEPDTRTVHLFDGKTISVGERFYGGGGFISLDEPAEGQQAAVEAVPGLRACLDATGARNAVLAYLTERSG